MKYKLMTLVTALALQTGCAGADFSSPPAAPSATGGTAATLNSTPPSTTGGSSGTNSKGTGGSSSGSGGSSGTASDLQHCVPGSNAQCNCLDNNTRVDGINTCNADGVYDGCKCGNPSTPSGTGGSAGSSAGSSGTGGTNTAGTGGSSSGSGGSSNAGTGGSSSGSGGTSTSGSGGTSTAGSSGSGGTSSSNGANFQNCTWEIESPNTAFSDTFYMSFVQDGGVEQSADCTGSGTTRTCIMNVDRKLFTEFWIYTGLADPAVWAPGWVGTASNVLAIVKIKGSCTGNENPIPFRITDNNHFRIEPKGSNVLGADWDHDGVATADDCDDQNPSIGSCMSNASDGTTPVAFYALGGDTTSSTLEFLMADGSELACQSVITTDPANSNATAMAVRCFVNVDLSKEFTFNIHAGDFYAVADTPCIQFFRIYAYAENTYALADLDNVAATSFPTQMFIRPRGPNCDVVLPAP